ncbi:hypothetical protein KBC31_01950 [Candidatus Saccharibacteria bacterium]|jgi:hypothetical protein|nr:hypothetical protein [Candidatus Saccharibacteria bacterium]
MSEQSYQPGVCNINTDEITYRRKAGYISLGITIIIFVTAVLLRNTTIAGAVAIFASISAISFLQAQNKFCVAYAGSGKQNATEGEKEATEIKSAKNRALDKAKANKMYLQAAAVGILAGGMSFTLVTLL